MFKKVLSIALAALMLVGCVSVFSACGKKKTDLTGGVEYAEKAKGIFDDAAFAALGDLSLTEGQTVKIGIICLHDENSTYDKNFLDAIDRAKAFYGDKIEVLKKTGIDESEACTKAAEDFVAAGCQIIFADSFGHESYMMEVAAKNPQVQFCHATGTAAHTSDLANYHNAFASIYEGRYLGGIVAGMKLNEMIAAGNVEANKVKIGYVGAFPYAEVISGYTSFFLGVKSVCPSVTMTVKYTNSWYDEAKEKEAALALINEGCVLISQHADSMGAPTACEENNVPNVSYNGSTQSACPKTFLVSSYIDWTPYFKYIIWSVANNKAIHDDFCGGIAAGSVKITEMNDGVIAAGTKAKIDETIAAFKAGTLHVFDTSKDNFITFEGEKVTEYAADVDFDEAYAKDTHVIFKDGGYFMESYFRSAPYFDLIIDGITVPKD